MKEWQDIEKIVFLNLKTKSLEDAEMFAVNKLLKIKNDFDLKKITKENATYKKNELKRQYSRIEAFYKLMPELINMIIRCEWKCEPSEDFANWLIKEYGLIYKKTQCVPIIQYLVIAVVDYYNDFLKINAERKHYGE